jgi:large subunit ribosomal protein L7/L12
VNVAANSTPHKISKETKAERKKKIAKERRSVSNQHIMALRTTRLLWRTAAASRQQQQRFLSTSPQVVSPKVQELFAKMVALSDDERILVGQVLSEKMGIPIVDFDAAPLAEEQTEEEETAPIVEKTVFELKLLGFDAKSKIKVIKEVRAITGLGLKDAKELVEGAPTVIKKDLKQGEAEELQKKLQEVGATMEIL